MARVVLAEALDRYFLLNRAPLARALQERGHEVTVVAAESGRAEEIRRAGFRFVPLPASVRTTRALASEASILATFARLYLTWRPHLVHHFTLRPVLYGSLAACLRPRLRVVNSITGLGYVFTEEERGARLRQLVSLLYRVALRRGHTIVQNPDDRQFFLDRGWTAPKRLTLVPGSGVDCERFAPSPEPPLPMRVILPGRLLRDKGVGEFVEAARQVRAVRTDLEFLLVGEPDPAHPTSIPEAQVREWEGQGWVRWLGFQADMPAVLASAHIVVLPSYREGFPKALLEACACARAVIGADAPGVREVVRPGETGLLVPVRNSSQLAEAILTLADNPSLRHQLARGARQLAERHSSQSIVEQILAVYRQEEGIPY